MSVSEHLSLSQVRAYVRGALHPSTLIGIDDHLANCEACRAALARESEAAFGAEAFARALAAPEARPESPHLTFEHLRGAVNGTLTDPDREWVDAHVALCMMCAEELRDLERFAATVPGRPAPASAQAPTTAEAPPQEVVAAPDRGALSKDLGRARPAVPRVTRRSEASDEPPFGYGERPPARMPWWIKAIAAVSLLALLQLWAC